jgi:hypothetical protein
VYHRRLDGVLTPAEQTVREEILAGLIADKGGRDRISTAEHVLAEVVASDAALLHSFNAAIDYVLQRNEKARVNPKALAVLDSYKRPLINSLAANLQRFGFERVRHVQTLNEILEDMHDENAQESPRTAEKPPDGVQ